MKKLIIVLTITASTLFIGCNNDIPSPDKDVSWIDVGRNVSMKIIELDGHKYLVTCRNGAYSYNAQTIHAASCPCLKTK